jgi:hypothetical protein
MANAVPKTPRAISGLSRRREYAAPFVPGGDGLQKKLLRTHHRVQIRSQVIDTV